MRYRIEYLHPRHVPEIAIIEFASFADPYRRKQLDNLVRAENVGGFVSRDQTGQVVGYLIYSISIADNAFVETMAVVATDRRRGIATELIATLIDYTSVHTPADLVVQLDERNVGAQVFLKRLGFRWEGKANAATKPTDGARNAEARESYVFIRRKGQPIEGKLQPARNLR